MAKFSKNNFYMIIHEIEDMETADQNIWVPIGILEIMYEDYTGIIDNYFHSKERDIDKLWEEINKISTGTLNIPIPKKEESWWFYDGKPYTIPTGPYDLTPKVTWTCNDNLSDESTRAYINTIPPERW